MQTDSMRSLRPLTIEERAELETDLKKTKDLAEWRRLFVILSYDEGQSIEELAKLTRLSRWTIEEYLKKYSSENKTKMTRVEVVLLSSLKSKQRNLKSISQTEHISKSKALSITSAKNTVKNTLVQG